MNFTRTTTIELTDKEAGVLQNVLQEVCQRVRTDEDEQDYEDRVIIGRLIQEFKNETFDLETDI